MSDKERRPSKKNSERENKKHPFKRFLEDRKKFHKEMEEKIKKDDLKKGRIKK